MKTALEVLLPLALGSAFSFALPMMIWKELDGLGVAMVLFRRSKWTRWLTYQVRRDDFLAEYLDRMESRMNARRSNTEVRDGGLPPFSGTAG